MAGALVIVPAACAMGYQWPAQLKSAAPRGCGRVLDAGTDRRTTPHRRAGIEGFGSRRAETALAIAREKAEGRGIEVEFAEADAFHLERLGRMFDTVLDCGLFHTFDDDERPGYVASLTSVTKQDGTLYVLSFGDEGPETGPHPISQEELRAAFNRSGGWDVAAIEPDRIHTRHHDDGAPAWFATIKRI
jgi:SAM-dependent methyltransferase